MEKASAVREINYLMYTAETKSMKDTKGKGEVPPGCLSVEPVTQVTRFSMPLEQSILVLCP